MADNICVAVRLRPLLQRENVDDLKTLWAVKENTIISIDSTAEPYTFDTVYDQLDTNIELYADLCSPIIESTMAGFHGTIFAYGQSGSGKTHTMTGSKMQSGLIYQAMDEIFETIAKSDDKEFLLRISYMEIYNEKIQDLFDDAENKTIKIQNDTSNQISVVNLSERIISTKDQMQQWMIQGETRRKFAATKANDRSSRSHVILRMIIESRLKGDEDAVMVSHLNFVDLAGSEKAADNSGERFREGCMINRSLLTLSQVISKLSEGESNAHINYRDSKLTRILQNALGGNSKTAIICTISPTCLEESHSTLKFASRAKTIKNKPVVNEVLSESALLKKYALEIKKLQKLVDAHGVMDIQMKKEDLEKQLQEKEKFQKEQEHLISKLKEMLVKSGSNSDTTQIPKKQRRETWSGPKLSQNSVCLDVPRFKRELLPLSESMRETENSSQPLLGAAKVVSSRHARFSALEELNEDNDEFSFVEPPPEELSKCNDSVFGQQNLSQKSFITDSRRSKRMSADRRSSSEEVEKLQSELDELWRNKMCLEQRLECALNKLVFQEMELEHTRGQLRHDISLQDLQEFHQLEKVDLEEQLKSLQKKNQELEEMQIPADAAYVRQVEEELAVAYDKVVEVNKVNKELQAERDKLMQKLKRSESSVDHKLHINDDYITMLERQVNQNQEKIKHYERLSVEAVSPAAQDLVQEPTTQLKDSVEAVVARLEDQLKEKSQELERVLEDNRQMKTDLDRVSHQISTKQFCQFDVRHSIGDITVSNLELAVKDSTGHQSLTDELASGSKPVSLADELASVFSAPDKPLSLADELASVSSAPDNSVSHAEELACFSRKKSKSVSFSAELSSMCETSNEFVCAMNDNVEMKDQEIQTSFLEVEHVCDVRSKSQEAVHADGFVEDMKKQLESQTRKVDEAESAYSDLQKQLDEKEELLETFSNEMLRLQDAAEDLKTKVTSLENDLRDKQEALEDERMRCKQLQQQKQQQCHQEELEGGSQTAGEEVVQELHVEVRELEVKIVEKEEELMASKLKFEEKQSVMENKIAEKEEEIKMMRSELEDMRENLEKKIEEKEKESKAAHLECEELRLVLEKRNMDKEADKKTSEFECDEIRLDSQQKIEQNEEEIKAARVEWEEMRVVLEQKVEEKEEAMKAARVEWEEMRVVLEQKVEEKEEEMKAARVEWEEMRVVLEQKVEEKEEEIKTTRVEWEEFNLVLQQKLEKKHEETKTALLQFEEMRSDLEQKVVAKEEEIKTAKFEWEEIQFDLEHKIVEKEEEMQKMRSKWEETKSTLVFDKETEDKEMDVKHLEMKVKQLNECLDAKEIELQQTQKDLEQLQLSGGNYTSQESIAAHLETKKAHLEMNLQDYEKELKISKENFEKAQCEVESLRSDLEAEKHLLEEKEMEIRGLTEKLQQMEDVWIDVEAKSKLIEQMTEELAESKMELTFKTKEISKLDERIIEVEEEMNRKEDEFEGIKEVGIDRINTLTDEVSDLRKEISELELVIEEGEMQVLDLREQMEEIIAEKLKESQDMILKSESQIKTLSEQVTTLEEAVKQKDSEMERILSEKVKLEEDGEDLMRAVHEKHELEEQLREKMNQISLITEEKSHIELDLSKKRSELQALDENRMQQDLELKESRCRIEDLYGKIQELEDAVNDKTKMMELISEEKKTKQQLLSEKSTQVEDFAQKMQQLERSLHDQNTELDKERSRMATLGRHLKSKDEELNNLKQLEFEFENMKVDNVMKAKNIADLQAQILELNKCGSTVNEPKAEGPCDKQALTALYLKIVRKESNLKNIIDDLEKVGQTDCAVRLKEQEILLTKQKTDANKELMKQKKQVTELNQQLTDAKLKQHALMEEKENHTELVKELEKKKIDLTELNLQFHYHRDKRIEENQSHAQRVKSLEEEIEYQEEQISSLKTDIRKLQQEADVTIAAPPKPERSISEIDRYMMSIVEGEKKDLQDKLMIVRRENRELVEQLEQLKEQNLQLTKAAPPPTDEQDENEPDAETEAANITFNWSSLVKKKRRSLTYDEVRKMTDDLKKRREACRTPIRESSKENEMPGSGTSSRTSTPRTTTPKKEKSSKSPDCKVQ